MPMQTIAKEANVLNNANGLNQIPRCQGLIFPQLLLCTKNHARTGCFAVFFVLLTAPIGISWADPLPVSSMQLKLLSEDAQWRALLHYDQLVSRISPHSRAAESDFFLSEAGKTDPRAELEATLRAMLSAEPLDDTHAICRFPARFLWLSKKVSLVVFYFRSLLASDFASGMKQYQHRALRLFSRLHLLTILHQHSGTHFCASIMAPQMMTRGYLIMPLILPQQPTVRTPYFMQLKAFSEGLTAFFRWVHFIRKLKNTATLRTEISGSITLT